MNNDFERVLVNSYNQYFKTNNTKALAYRLKQSRFAPQPIDINVDSREPALYLGIECKSISTDKGASALYFSQHFTVDKRGKHQIERISDYLDKTGRKGYLAVELRNGIGKGREAYMIPFKMVTQRYHNHDTKLSLTEIRSYPALIRVSNAYNVIIGVEDQ